MENQNLLSLKKPKSLIVIKIISWLLVIIGILFLLGSIPIFILALEGAQKINLSKALLLILLGFSLIFIANYLNQIKRWVILPLLILVLTLIFNNILDFIRIDFIDTQSILFIGILAVITGYLWYVRNDLSGPIITPIMTTVSLLITASIIGIIIWNYIESVAFIKAIEQISEDSPAGEQWQKAFEAAGLEK